MTVWRTFMAVTESVRQAQPRVEPALSGKEQILRSAQDDSEGSGMTASVDAQQQQ